MHKATHLVQKNKFVCYLPEKKLTQPPTLHMQGTPIRLTTQHKFLCLILDAPYLNWKTHIEYFIIVCLKN